MVALSYLDREVDDVKLEVLWERWVVSLKRVWGEVWGESDRKLEGADSQEPSSELEKDPICRRESGAGVDEGTQEGKELERAGARDRLEINE